MSSAEINAELQRSKYSKVARLAALLKEHQEVVYRQESVLKYFTGDDEVLHVASNCWQQIHGRIGDVIQEKYQRVLVEFGVMEKLSELEALEKQHKSGNPAWRPSGNPHDDFTEAAGAVIRISAIPEFEKMYAEVQSVTSKLQDLIKEKQQVLSSLETEISQRTDQLCTNTDDLS